MSPDNGPSDYNRTQMFVFSGIYQLPFGRGKQFLNTANTLADTFLGGWSLGSIIPLYSGQPSLMSSPMEMSPTPDGGKSTGSEKQREAIHAQRRTRKWLKAVAEPGRIRTARPIHTREREQETTCVLLHTRTWI